MSPKNIVIKKFVWYYIRNNSPKGDFMEIKLNNEWLIISGNDNENADYHISGIPKENTVTAQLPCFTHMYIEDHVGISWYEKCFSPDALPSDDEVALLCFEQAAFRTTVSVNGKVVGTHTGVEDPFSFDVTDILKAGENRITVRISKPHEKDIDGYTFDEIPHRNQSAVGLQPGMCYNESGICGNVSLKIIPKTYIDDIFLEPDSNTGEIRAEITVINKSKNTENAQVTLKCGISPSGEINVCKTLNATLNVGKNVIETRLKVDDFELWSIDNPVLYNVITQINCLGKEHLIATRIGFRTFEVKEDGYFYLNEKRIFLKCTHTGNCMPLSTHHIALDKELLRKDFLMAKATGFNTVRFISGAALPMQLDLCDEIGLMVYEEPTAGWRTRNGVHAKECFVHDTLSMIKRDRNHPSVTIWGLLNETPMEGGFIDVCSAARDILPELRKVDKSRLVIFSSGRWDKNLSNGSLCNPYKTEWEFLWNGDGTSDRTDTEYHQNTGFGNRNTFEVGDVHYYPQHLPHTEYSINFLRTVGSIYQRPVFISETGIGSALDTVSLVNRFKQDGRKKKYPDVKMIHQINDIFLNELHKYKFDDLYPFPSELMKGSFENHAKYREYDFNILRSNPYLNGLSLTGMLDHSICGEGLWTLYREFKPKIADVLQTGFSHLMWCVLPKKTSLFKGEAFEVEVLISNEDKLKINERYHVRAAIIKDGRVYDLRKYSFVADGRKSFVIPVFTDSFPTGRLDDGEYTFKVELFGAQAAGGTCRFNVYDHVTSKTNRSVYCIGMSDGDKAKIQKYGFKISDKFENNVVLAGEVTKDNIDEIKNILADGAFVICLKAGDEENLSLELLPEERRPEKINREVDWLYHRETVANYKSSFFDGMPCGTLDVELYGKIFSEADFDATEEQVPDVTHAIAFSTGFPNPRGYLGGFKLGTYYLGKSKLILNTFKLLDSAVPMGEKLLINIIDNV